MLLWWNSYLCCRCVKHHWKKIFFSFCFIAVHIHIFKIWANWGTTGWLKRLKRIRVHWAGTVVRSLARAGLQQPGCWPSDTASAPPCANLGWNYSRGSQDVPWAGLNSGLVSSLPPAHPGVAQQDQHRPRGTPQRPKSNQLWRKKYKYQCQGLVFTSWGAPSTAVL